MPIFDHKARGFSTPTALPTTPVERESWQAANRAWWENRPMRYDWGETIGAAEYSEEYYHEIDRRFFDALRHFLPWRERPLEQLIDFAGLRSRDVLEIGVGCGTHAQLLAENAKSYVGIDLTDFATRCTSERMKLFGVDATIVRMDAEIMDFPDESFDFIWSWGVVHHSANTRRILQQMHRVLRPGGTAVTMVYHRNFWNYYFISGVFRGVFCGEFLKTRSLNDILQKQTDGALARHYTEGEWKAVVGDLFAVRSSQIFGMKNEILPLPGGSLKTRIESLIPDSVARTLTNKAKMGTFLVTELQRKGYRGGSFS
jgi:ubiquinone/menaquinone biosynthesis C-methylase UbiE